MSCGCPSIAAPSNPAGCAPVSFCPPSNFGLEFPSLVGPQGPAGSNTLIVENIAALKAIDATVLPQNTFIVVLGYFVVDDQGGGFFVYDAADVTPDNYGTIIEPNNGIGRWHRLYTGPINSRWFGCDVTGTTDSALQLQAWLDSGDNLLLGIGTYMTGSQLNVNRSNVTLSGQGQGSKLLCKPDTDINILEFQGASNAARISNILVENILVDGNRLTMTTAGTTRHGIGFRFVNGLIVRNSFFQYMGAQTGLSPGLAAGKGVWVGYASKVVVTNCSFYACKQAISLAEGSNESIVSVDAAIQGAQITNNFIDGVSATFDAGDAISATIKLNSTISGNVIRNISTPFMGIFVDAATSPGVIGIKCIISGNVFYNIGGNAIESDGAAGAVYFVITGNHIDTTGATAIQTWRESVIADNVVLNVAANQYGISASRGALTITGNLIMKESGNYLSGIFIYSGDDPTKNIVISNNVVKNATSGSIYVTTNDFAGAIIRRLSVTGNVCDNSIVIKALNGVPSGVRDSLMANNIATAYVAIANGVDGCIVVNNMTTAA